MRRWIGLLLRLVVGGIWIWAGLLKIGDPASSVTAVRAYQLLPYDLAETVGHLLPVLELTVGIVLVLGLITRVSGGVSALLQIAFIIGISSVWARGISINCGCFGDGGADPNAISHYPWEIARDVALLLASAYLAWRPRTALSVDGVLFPERPVAVDDLERV
ncbi:DoxX family protein [Nocardioides marmorisolisilvae]|uniref:DoxX family membrane protein n=1 Tax=Nocardioides marmorisolisilvae TaxID=1542737 RepID=A0A3N0DTL2_9ACTN|nr:MauE/DoxX family redox-associated membrane protein [Nocardioides marmorisolisilvae]RNL78743.1 DoxX family membrane protein [Nocardioides marmorisolisilvae]